MATGIAIDTIVGVSSKFIVVLPRLSAQVYKYSWLRVGVIYMHNYVIQGRDYAVMDGN